MKIQSRFKARMTKRIVYFGLLCAICAPLAIRGLVYFNNYMEVFYAIKAGE